MTAEIGEKTPLEKAVGKLNAPDIASRLEALAHMDPVSVGIILRRLNPHQVNIADRRALLFGNVD